MSLIEEIIEGCVFIDEENVIRGVINYILNNHHQGQRDQNILCSFQFLRCLRGNFL